MAKNWESDFRHSAIQASIALTEQSPQRNQLEYPFSYCLPVSGSPLPSWITPGRIVLLFVVLGFGAIAGGAVIASFVPPNDEGSEIWIALALSLTGMLLLLMPALLQKRISMWFIGDRAKTLLSWSSSLDLVSCELGNSEKPTLSIDGDDFVLILFDTRNRRLIIEGVAASYQIRREDVEFVRPFEFQGMLGADIKCRIDERTSFRFGVLQTSIRAEFVRQLPILPQRWIKNQLFTKCMDTIGPNQDEGAVPSV